MPFPAIFMATMSAPVQVH